MKREMHMSGSADRRVICMGVVSMACIAASVLILGAVASDVIDSRWGAAVEVALSMLVLLSVVTGVLGFTSVYGKLGLLGAVAATFFIVVAKFGIP
ncbi:MAG: hypothetical protein GVY24_07740 [Planctomycetes bacterium]|jgi:hypothetical protein|nr:hypothetical protein [Planctomycetota bacterium]